MNNTFAASQELSLRPDLTPGNELRPAYRDIDAEKREAGYLATYSPITEREAVNNPGIVRREGMHQHAAGGYRPDDIVNIGGMQMSYDMAVSAGLMVDQGQPGGNPSSPVVSFESDAEVALEPEPTALSGSDLLNAQLQLAVGDKAPEVLSTFGEDIVENGEISEAGLEYAQRHLSMSPEQVATLYEDMRGTASNTMVDLLEVGDSRGLERVEFLVDLAENGNRKEQAIVRNLWFLAATGKLKAKDAAQAFDYLYSLYE